jgi:YgiT-type zinc finger domain-containing protein
LEGRRCVVCKTGVLEEGRKTLTLERGDTTIVIKQVPGLICNTCGEGYFDEDVTDRLLKLVEEAAAAGVEVDVRRYVPEGEEIDRAA